MRDSVGRKHILQSSTIDDVRKSKNSFIYLIEDKKFAETPKFDRIACFFSHQYIRSYHFAKVKLFKDVYRETSTGIWYALNPEKSFEYSVISIDRISADIPVDITDNGCKVSFLTNLLSLHWTFIIISHKQGLTIQLNKTVYLVSEKSYNHDMLHHLFLLLAVVLKIYIIRNS